MRSWMGDEEANRRREMDSYRAWRDDPDYASARSPTGRGPRGYTRSDSRIFEDVCDRLGFDWDVDATDIEVRVNNGEVTLDGTVDSRAARQRAEYLAADVWGVRDVQNNLRVRERAWRSGDLTGSSSAALEQTTGLSSGTPVTRTKPSTH
jgi:osmotically-inducible protein OsmY